MCSCNKGKTAKAYVVTFANGGTTTVTSLVAAKLTVGKNPGASYKAAS